jgi:uncharacterized membrane protein
MGWFRICIIIVPAERVVLIWNLLWPVIYVQNIYLGFVANVLERMKLYTNIISYLIIVMS